MRKSFPTRLFHSKSNRPKNLLPKDEEDAIIWPKLPKIGGAYKSIFLSPGSSLRSYRALPPVAGTYVIASPFSSRRNLDLGTRFRPEMICTPCKLIFGNYADPSLPQLVEALRFPFALITLSD
jgi:hypothetical protein